MDFDPLGRRTNNAAHERLRYYKGCAIVNFKHLVFGDGPVRQPSNKNLERLLKIFEIEGCANLEPEHRVAAMINLESLQRALHASNISQTALIDPTKQERLELDENDRNRMTVIKGNHRLMAGQRFGVDCWLVEIYLDGKRIDELAR